MIADWLKARIPLKKETFAQVTDEPVPGHLRFWWFCLGGTPFYLLIVQIVTGILLTFYYIPNPDHAYESVANITYNVSFGWWLRSIHHWASQLMIVAVILHVLRVFFTGAYRKPRELNWMIGVCILGVVLFFGFTGYSLVYEQLSYWGATVAANLTSAVPFIGGFLSRLLVGGESVGPNTLTRFFIFHIGILPTVIFALLAVHVFFIRLHGVTEYQFKFSTESQRKSFPFFPDHVLTELIVGLVLTIVLVAMACIFPAGLAEKANPLVTPAHIKPEWYFYATFRWLKLTTLTFAVLSTLLAGVVFFLWPFVDKGLQRVSSKVNLSILIGIVGFLIIIILTLWEVLAPHA